MVSKAEKQRRKQLAQQRAQRQLSAAVEGLSQNERDTVHQYFSQLRAQCRAAAIAQPDRNYSGSDPCASNWGGVFAGPSQNAWPIADGMHLEGILQIKVSDLPFVPRGLEPFALIQLFASWRDWNGAATYEGGPWRIVTYPHIDDLLPMDRPFPAIMESMGIQWSLANTEIPHYPDNLGIVDDTLDQAFHAIESCHLLVSHEFPTWPGTKVGGWPVSHQNGTDTDRYVIQVDSDHGWQWYAQGVAFLLIAKNGTWDIQCDFD